jgi:hypothetical protein
VSLPLLTEILGDADPSGALTELVARGLVSTDRAIDALRVPAAVAGIIRCDDPDPLAAERIRARALTALNSRVRSGPPPTPLRLRPEIDERERQVAFVLQNELMHRVPFRPLDGDAGGLREALDSGRELLRLARDLKGSGGPDVARPSTATRPGYGEITHNLIEVWLRPFLTYWHPLLSDWEDQRPPGTAGVAHERAWQHYDALRAALASLRAPTVDLAHDLATITHNTVGLR